MGRPIICRICYTLNNYTTQYSTCGTCCSNEYMLTDRSCKLRVSPRLGNIWESGKVILWRFHLQAGNSYGADWFYRYDCQPRLELVGNVSKILWQFTVHFFQTRFHHKSPFKLSIQLSICSCHKRL